MIYSNRLHLRIAQLCRKSPIASTIPMKQYRIEYYHYNPSTDIYELHSVLLNASEFSEFIIKTAHSKDYRVREVKEL